MEKDNNKCYLCGFIISDEHKKKKDKDGNIAHAECLDDLKLWTGNINIFKRIK